MEKSKGVTETERMLADFGDRTFLRLWSYANPYKDDGHEMCDLFAVFGDDVFIFFDRSIPIPLDSEKSPDVLWNRWKRKVIDDQIATAHGVERYIRMGRPIYLDATKQQPFPIPIDVSKATFHKIIIAHGAKEACERASSDNVYGSLAINYVDPKQSPPTAFFNVQIDRNNPVHIFDSHNLPILLTELDTVIDFSNYLHEKRRAIGRFSLLMYCGEEDLLGHYLLSIDKDTHRHFIGPRKGGDSHALIIEEGCWANFIETDIYKNTKAANAISYRWDALIQRTCQNALNGTVGGNSDIAKGLSAIHEMVKEPRFMRRTTFQKMEDAVQGFPEKAPEEFTRHLVFLPSYHPNVAYVFLQVAPPDDVKNSKDYREKRRTMLEVACGAAKNKFPSLVKVIGIAIDAPRYSNGVDGEDFILMPCETWTDEDRSVFEEKNKDLEFFKTKQMRAHRERISEFVLPSNVSARSASRSKSTGPKVGRNEPCPCGSGEKYKKCHGSPATM